MLILFAVCGLNAEEPKSVILSVDNYPPYIDGRRYDKGQLGKIVETVFSHHHRKVKFEFMSWPETQLKIEQGQGFTFIWYKSEDSALDWIYSQPIDYLETDLVFKLTFDLLSDVRFAYLLLTVYMCLLTVLLPFKRTVI